VSCGVGWRWWARAPEYLQLSSGVGNVTQTRAFWVEHHAGGGNRGDKFERELALLQQDWDEQPGDARTAFNLGRAYDALGRREEAIEWFRQRLDLGGCRYRLTRRGGCLRYCARRSSPPRTALARGEMSMKGVPQRY
jgi:tetratricopeptide (TPR) repeat protein